MMQFDDSLHGMGGQALLNTSIKSEGGVSVHNTSRGEEEDKEEKEAEEEGEPGLAFDVDSIKVMAETVGMGALPEEAARELGEEVTYRGLYYGTAVCFVVVRCKWVSFSVELLGSPMQAR